MKVALIGNMNNNHFAFLRFLRDEGVDAYLFLYKNEQSHFKPENDTWEIDKWKDYIIQTDLMNGFKGTDFSLLYYPKPRIRNLFHEFDILICNGSFPIYAKRANLIVDFFLPYSVGIEFLVVHKESIKRFLAFSLTRWLQLSALNSHTRKIVTLDFSEGNLKNFKYLRHKPTIMGIPMVYNREVPDDSKVRRLSGWVDKFRNFEMVVFSHVSHIWKNIPSNWSSSIKKNDVLIEGFAKYLEKTEQKRRSVLVLSEYGTDVEESKKLIQSLRIEENVVWLPQMSRKEIMYLLNFVDIGGGEFGGYLWGGTGWEFMAKGVPFLQYVDCDQQVFKKMTGLEFPEILNVNSSEEIAFHFSNYFKDPEFYLKKGESLKKWFSQAAGMNLVKRYVDLFKDN